MITDKTFRRLSPVRRSKERGAVLMVGLIILVVLTLLGVQAMRTNVAQERMSYNMRERNLAFQASESALRVGEGAEENYDSSRVPLVGDPKDWDGVANATGTLTNFDPALAQNPSYNVGPPQLVRVGLDLPPKFRLIYPITSRGVGGQATSVVIVQTGFEPPN